MKMSKLFYSLLFIPGMTMAGGNHNGSSGGTVSMDNRNSANAVASSNASANSNSVNNISVGGSNNAGNRSTNTVNVEGHDVLPSMSVGNSVSTGTCYAGSNLGGGGGPVSIILPFVKEDKQCTYRQNIQIVQQLDQEGARKMLCLLDGYAEMTGDCNLAPVVEKEQVKTYKPF